MTIEDNNIPYIKKEDKIILFDGICKLCNAWCRFIIKYDRGHIFKLTSMQSDKGQTILECLDRPTDQYETMLYIENNIVYEKSSAFIKIVSHMSFPIRLLFILKLLPAVIRDYIYDRIAINRYKLFGKYNECKLPPSDHSNRYL